MKHFSFLNKILLALVFIFITSFSVNIESVDALTCRINSLNASPSTNVSPYSYVTVSWSGSCEYYDIEGITSASSPISVYNTAGTETYTLYGYGDCTDPFDRFSCASQDTRSITVTGATPTATLEVQIRSTTGETITQPYWAVSGGYQSASPSTGSGSTLTHTVYPFVGGSTFTVSGPGNISGYTGPSVSNSDGGGNSISISPNQSKWVRFTYSRNPVSPCTINLLGNGSNGPLSVSSGSAVSLTWSSTNANSTSGSGFNTGGAVQNGVGVTLYPTVNTTYTINGTGDGGNCSDSVTVNVSTVVEPPINLTALPLPCGGITVGWNPVPGATSYTLRDNGVVIYTGASTSYSHTGLAAFSSHSYSVSATVGGVMSAYSSSVSATAPAACGSTTPKNLTATPASCGTGTINVAWDSVFNATSYTLRDNGVVVYSGASISYSHGGLVAGSSHSYTVSATVSGVESPYTSAVSATAPVACPTAPPTPTGLSVTPGSCGTGTINVSWNASSGATSYTLRDNGVVIYTGASTSYSHTGLAAGSWHSYTVSATNSNGSSANSGAFNWNAPALCPTPTVSLLASPNPVNSGNNITLSWSPSNVTSCTKSASPANAQWTGSVSGANGSQTIGSMSVNTTFTISCSGIYGSAVDDEFVTIIAPSPDLTAGSVSPTTATIGTALTFTGTITNSGSAATGASFNNLFQVATAANGGGTVSTISSNSRAALNAGANGPVTSNSYTFTGSAGTRSVRLCADNNASMVGTITESNEGNNCGAWANVTVSAALSVPTVTISASPASGTVNVVNPQLTWSATNSPTSCTASGDWSGAKATSGTNQAQGVLTSVRTYTYTLTCSNAAGASAPVSATVVVSAAPTPPSTPTGLVGTASACGTGTINVSWNASSGATSYTLRDGSTVIYTGASTSYSHTGLVAGSSHSYTVLATNANGSSAYSSAVAATAPAVCAAPDLTAGSVSPTTATIGTALTFTGTITNSGSAATGASFNNLFQVATAANGGGTVSTISSNSRAALNAGANGPVTSNSYTFTGSAGTRSVRLCADNNASMVGTITESNEGNNCGAWANVTVSALARPDLTPGAITPTTATVGVSQSFTSTITNGGTAATGASFSNRFRVATAANGGGTVSVISANTLAALNAGANAPITSTGYTFGSAGTFSVQICADTNASGIGAITESNEGNNCGSWTNITVTAAASPDLTAGSVSPTTATIGTALTFTGTITNSGSAATGASFNNLFQVATAANGGGTVSTISSNSRAALNAGANGPVTSNSYTFTGSAGTRSVRLCADNNASMVGTITESNEGNNCGAWANVTVSAAVPPLDYSLSNNGNVVVTKGAVSVQGQSQITATLITGTTQAMTMTAVGMPSGVSVSYGNQGCSPTCSGTVTFTVQPSATAGTYPITVNTVAGSTNRSTNFNLVINAPASLSVTCTASPSPAYIGQPVTWTANVSGGVPPYTYTWSGTNFSGTPTTNPYVFTYQTTGSKSATVTVNDNVAQVAVCPAATLQIGVDPQYKEF